MSFSGDLYPSAGATSVLTTKGDLVDFDTIRQRLAIGSANQILQVKSNLPSWETVPLADTVLTTAGDVLYENATPELARLGIASNGDVLTLAGGLPSWATPSAGGATVTEVTDIALSAYTETSTTLVTVDTNFTLTLPTITDGVCVVTANLCCTNDNAGSLTTASLYDVTNTVPLTVNTTSTSGDYNNSQTATTPADGKVVQVYLASMVAGTAKIKTMGAMTDSSETSMNLYAFGVG